MTAIYLESPFRGRNKEETRQNIIYARLCMLDALKRDEAPFLSHLLYTQVWSEQNRERGLLAGKIVRLTLAMNPDNRHVFYIDLGMTEGMQLALEHSPFSSTRLEKRLLKIKRADLAEMRINPFPELDGIYDIEGTNQQ